MDSLRYLKKRYAKDKTEYNFFQQQELTLYNAGAGNFSLERVVTAVNERKHCLDKILTAMIFPIFLSPGFFVYLSFFYLVGKFVTLVTQPFNGS